MNEQEKLIDEQFNALPVNLQRAINSVPWKIYIQNIARENNLDEEQAESLERETMFVIYGFEAHNDYISNLIQNIGVPEKQALGLAESVSNKIFDSILQKADELEGNTNNSSKETTGNLPMVEEGETVHEVAHVESQLIEPEGSSEPERPTTIEKPTTYDQRPTAEAKPEEKGAQLPDYRYVEGKDPYREPLK